MARPVSAQFIAFGLEFEVETTLLVQTLTLEASERRAGDRAPTAVHLTDPIAPRGKVAYPAATSVEFTTTGISHEPRSVALRGDTLVISVPARRKQSPPLGSFFNSLRKFIAQEKQQMVTHPASQEQRLHPPRQFHRASSKNRKLGKPRQASQQFHQYPQHSATPYPSTQAHATFWQRNNRPFPFKREFIPEIFKSLLRRPNFLLPEPLRPDEVGRTSDPNYCPYHRTVGHVLENCLAFKEWLEEGLKEGSVVIPDEYLAYPPSGSTKIIFDLTGDMSDSSDD